MNSAYQKGELSITQKRGILNLIFKKNEKTLLSNWRPITLLNTITKFWHIYWQTGLKGNFKINTYRPVRIHQRA